jgi:hypothetical protein
MIMPEVGELIYSVDIVNVTKPYNNAGEGKITSYLVRGARSKVEPIGGSQVDDTQQSQAFAQRYNVWIRYRENVTPFQQIIWDGTRLVQSAPPEAFMGRWILMHCAMRIDRIV